MAIHFSGIGNSLNAKASNQGCSKPGLQFGCGLDDVQFSGPLTKDTVQFGHGNNTVHPGKLSTAHKKEFGRLTSKKGPFNKIDITFEDWMNAGRPKTVRNYERWVSNGREPVKNNRGGRR